MRPMRLAPAVCAVALLSFAGTTAASPPPGQTMLTLSISTDEAKLIVETLGEVDCRMARERANCDLAVKLLDEIRSQALRQMH